MEKKTAEDKTSTFAQRLQEKLDGSTEPVHTDENAAELVESQLDVVSGGGHASHVSISNAQDPTGGKE